MPLSDERRAELRKLADAATPGLRTIRADGSVANMRGSDADQIQAFDRETCLALLDAAEERDRLRQRVADLEAGLNRFHDRVHDIAGESFLNWRGQLQEACAAARLLAEGGQ